MNTRLSLFDCFRADCYSVLDKKIDLAEQVPVDKFVVVFILTFNQGSLQTGRINKVAKTADQVFDLTFNHAGFIDCWYPVF